MHRYVAVVWNTEDSNKALLADVLGTRISQALPGWEMALYSSGLNVYHTGSSRGSNKYRLEHERGVILGTLFSCKSPQTSRVDETSFDQIETDLVCDSQVRHLIENYWGRYVAFIKRANHSGAWIVRDPTGALPCFIAKFQGVDIIFSHIEDCADLGLIAGSINWDHIASYLWFDHMVTRHTGLDHVYQIQAGDRIVAGSDCASVTPLWNPAEISGRRAIDDRPDAAEGLRATIQSCVGAWAGCYDSVLVELSGGLDSSVVLSCLSHMRNAPELACENHFTRDPAGDERVFARQAAASAAVELIETPITLSDRTLESMFDSDRVPTPTMMTFIPETQSRRKEIIKLLGIEVVFSGQGGDHLFQSLKTRQIAAEYASHHGLRRELLRVISDTSRLTRTSLWAVIVTVIASGLLRRPADPYDSVEPSFLLSDATRNALNPAHIRHSWIDLAVNLPACKQRQIFDIIDTQNFHRAPCIDADVVHPLISQPIIEMCLQISSYTLTYGGIDRALVRDAFRGTVPVDILARVSKGATTGYFNNVLAKNAASLRELLLGGALVAEGLLDKRRTESALSESSLIRRSDLLFPVLDALRAELWLRSWASIDHRVVG